jgi:hypothetical protein
MIKSKLMPVFSITDACVNCQAKGMTTCQHVADDLPHWISPESRLLVKNLYGEDNEEDYKREILGSATNNRPECFAKDKVDALFDTPGIITQMEATHIFVAIDPCSGSAITARRSSDYAMVAIIDPNVTVVAADAMSEFDPELIEHRFVQTLTRLLEIPHFNHAMIILAIENMTGLEHTRIGRVFTNAFPNRVVVMQEKELKTGVNTTHAVKKNMMELTRGCFNKNHVRMSADFVTGHAKRADLFKEWRGQLSRYREFKEAPKNAFGSGKQAWSGKINGAPDDLAVTLQLAIYWRERFWNDPFYVQYHRRLAQ